MCVACRLLLSIVLLFVLFLTVLATQSTHNWCMNAPKLLDLQIFAISFESSNQKELRTEYLLPLVDVLTCYVERFHLPRHTVINAVNVLVSW